METDRSTKPRWGFRLVMRITVVALAFAMALLMNRSRAATVCSITWDGGAGTSSWHDAANWNPDQLPGASDHVCINTGLTPTVIFSTGTTDILTLGSNAEFTLSGGTLNLTDSANGSVIDGAFTLSGGTLGGASDVEIGGPGPFTLSGGVMTGSGVTTFHPFSGVTGSLSAIDLRGGRTFRNLGTIDWAGGTVQLFDASVVDNQGRLDIQADVVMNDFSPPGQVLNTGTIEKLVGTGEARINPALDNDGVLRITSGTLSLNGGTGSGMQSDGEYRTKGSEGCCTLQFGGGGLTHELGATSQVFVDHVVVAGGTVNVHGLWGTGGISVPGGTVNFESPATTGDLTLCGGTIGGSADLTVTGSLDVCGGLMTGAGATIFSPNGGATGTLNSVDLRGGRTFVNQGTIDWTGGTVQLFDGSVVENQGTLDIQADVVMNDYAPSGQVLNTGTIVRSAGGGDARINPAVDNDGTVQVDSGTLSLNGGTGVGHEAIGTYQSDPGSNVQLGGGGLTHQLGPTSQVTGDGTVTVRGSTVNVAGLWDTGGTTLTGGTLNLDPSSGITGSFTLAGGTLAGAGDLTVTGSITLNGGVMTGTGATIFDPFGPVDGVIANGADLRGGRTLRNLGTIDWTGTGFLQLFDGSVIDNQGTLDLQSDAGIRTYSPSDQILNTGTIIKSAGAGEFRIDPPLDNDGTVQVDSGTLRFTGGTGSDHQSEGTYTADSGANMVFGGNEPLYDLGSSSLVNGGGEVTIDGGIVTHLGTWSAGLGLHTGSIDLDSDSTLPSLTIDGGRLGGQGDVTVTGLFELKGGTMEGPGLTEIAADPTPCEVSGDWNLTLARRLEIGKRCDWLPGNPHLSGGSTVEDDRHDPSVGWDISENVACSGDAPDDQIIVNGFLENAGTFTITGASFDVHGTVTTDAGATTNINGPFTNYDPATKTLTGGEFVVAGTLAFRDADVQTLAANLTLDGPDAEILDQNGVNVTNDLATVESGATLTIANDFQVDPVNPFVNRGTVIIDNSGLNSPGGSFTNLGTVSIGVDGFIRLDSGAYTQTVGSTVLVDPSAQLSAPDGIDIQGGSLSGVGQVLSPVTNSGTVSPGQSPGILTVSNDYTQDSAGVLSMEIGGTTPGAGFDQINVSGAATLGGTLQLSTINGFSPVLNQKFKIVTYASHTGTFTAVTGYLVGKNLYFQVSYNAGNVTLTVKRAAIRLTPSSGPPGTPFTVQGVGFGPNEQVRLLFVDSLGVRTNLGSATTDSLGNFTKNTGVPAGAATGSATVGAQGQTSKVLAKARFTVT